MAVGLLSWKPKDFWQSTPWEFSVSMRGYSEAQQAKHGTSSTKRMTKNDLFNLRDRCNDLRGNNGDS